MASERQVVSLSLKCVQKKQMEGEYLINPGEGALLDFITRFVRSHSGHLDNLQTSVTQEVTWCLSLDCQIFYLPKMFVYNDSS